MAPARFFGRLLKRDKAPEGDNGDRKGVHTGEHHHGHHNEAALRVGSMGNGHNAASTPAGSTHLHASPAAEARLTPKASKMSKTESTDSFHGPGKKLSRFLEKRWAHHEQRIEEWQQRRGRGRDTSDKISLISGSTTPTGPIKAIKFDDFGALLSLTHKYGKVPAASENLYELYVGGASKDIAEASAPENALIIGKGAGGSVFPIYDSATGKVYAMKKIRQVNTRERPESYLRKLHEEYELARKMEHQNIVRTYDLLSDEDLHVIVMDYVPYDFFTLIMAKGYTQMEAYCYFKQMVNGVAYLHGRGVAHRDLKLDNCVVGADGILKLVDFGSAVIWDTELYNSGQVSTWNNEVQSKSPSKVSGILGSDPYLAPEVFYQSYYDPTRADMWSLAIVFCCMIMHQFPWRLPKPKEDKSYNMFTMNNKEIEDDKGRKKLVGPQRVLNKLPQESRELLGSMFELIPDRRMSVLDVQRNSWFQSIDYCHYDGEGLVKGDHEHHFITRQEFDSEAESTSTPGP